MTPPRLARWLLERALDREAAEAVGGDLSEGLQSRRTRSRSDLGARAWYWREVLMAVLWSWRRTPANRHGDDRRRRTMIDTLGSDFRQSVRALVRAPGFSLGIIVPLAVAVALASTVFAVVHAVLLRDLPYPQPDRLLVVGEHAPDEPVGTIGYETVLDLRGAAGSLSGLAAMGGWTPTLTSPATQRLQGMRVTSNFFSVLGVRPALGRDFTPEDDTPETRRVVILSNDLWRRQFGADPGVVGRTIAISETEYRVIGVLPASFEPLVSGLFYSPADIWSPLGYQAGRDSSCRTCRHLRALGAAAPGRSPAAVLQELERIHASLAVDHPADYGADVIGVERLSDRLSAPMRQPLSVLFVAVLLVLAIAVANALSLVVARASEREPELSLRAALGAGASDLLRHRAVEALLLCGAAGLLGVAAGQALTSWLLAHAPATLPRADHVGFNGGVLLFVGGSVLVSAMLLAGLPAVANLRRSRLHLSPGGRTTAGRGLIRGREALVVVDVALAMALALGAGAMIRSVDRLLAVDPGFAAPDVHLIGLSLVGPRWAKDSAVYAFQRDLESRLSGAPGVESVAIAGQVPLNGNFDLRGGYLEERNTGRASDIVDFQRYSISPEYFRVMGIPLLRGRSLTDGDRVDTEPVMLVNETAARAYWPGADPIGRRVAFGADGAYVRVVGVVGDVRHYGLDVAPEPQMYRPQSQMTDSFIVLLVKTARFEDVLPRVRTAVSELAPDVPLYGITSMDELMEASAATRRFTASLLEVFAAAAALMTAAGLYGVVAFTVSRRRREFGIRLALGAQKTGIRRLVLARGLGLIGLGVAAGLLLVPLVGRLLAGQLYETRALDPGSLAIGLVMVAGIGIVAHLVPVGRATRVSPTIALRGD